MHCFSILTSLQPTGVVPVLVGPLNALIAILPGLLVALGGVILAMFRPSSVKKLIALLWSQKIAVTLVLAVGVGVFFLVPKLFSGKGDVAKASEGTDWPLWRGGSARRGAVLDAEDPQHGGVQWVFTDGAIKTFYASPAVVGNRVYTTSARYEYFHDNGAVYSIDADGGELVWKYDADRYRATFSSPAVSGKYLVVGEGLHLTNDSRIICLDVEQSEKKREAVRLWQYRTRSHVESSPCISDGKVCIGAGDDGLYCFQLEPDAEGNPVVLWHLDGKEYPDCEASPVIHDGKVYFSLGNAGQAVCCVDAKSGELVWRVEAPYPVFGSPTISQGKLFVGMGTGNYVQSAEEVAAELRTELRKQGKPEAEVEAAVKSLAPVGEVWCIDLQTHEVLWRFPVGRTILGAIAEADGRLYFGSRDKHLYCVSEAGKLVRKWNARSPIVTSPAVGRGHVYVVTTAGRLYALDADSLKPVWEIDLNSDSMSSPTVARGHVYVGTTTGGFLCAGEPGGLKQKPIWAGSLGGPGRSGCTEGSSLGTRGGFSWRYPKPEEDSSETSRFTVTAPPAFLEGTFYLGIQAEGRTGLAALQLTDQSATPLRERWFCPAANPVRLSPAAFEDTVFFVDGRKGDADRKLRYLDAETGHIVWERPVAPEASGQFVITRRELLIADRGGMLSCLEVKHGESAAPSLLWSQPVGSVVGMPLVVGDIVLAAVDSQSALVALDLPTGGVLWRRELSSRPTTAPVFAGGQLWVGDAQGLTAYDIVNGEPLHVVACGPVAGALVCDDERLACINDTGEVVLVDSSSVQEVARVQGADKAKPPVLARDAVFYYDGKAIRRFQGAGRRQRSTAWCSVPDWMGKMSTPMIVAKSEVYFATDKLGFVCIKSRR